MTEKVVLVPKNEIPATIRSVKVHNDSITSISISPDGKYIVSGSKDKKIQLWETSTGKGIKTFRGKWYNPPVTSVSFSPDGMYIVSGDESGTVALWDVNTGKEIKTFKGRGFIKSVRFSHDGMYIAALNSDGTIKLWDVNTGKEIKTFGENNDFITSISFSPDGMYIVSGGIDGTIEIWEINTGKKAKTFKGLLIESDPVSIEQLYEDLINPNIPTNLDILTEQFLKYYTGRILGFVPLFGLSISYDARYVAGFMGGTIKLWDVNTGKEIKTSKVHNNFITSISFSPDGMYIVSRSLDGTTEIWEINTGKKVKYKRQDGSTSIAISPDGMYIVFGGTDGTIEIWELFSLLKWRVPEKDPFETSEEYEVRVQRCREEFEQKVSGLHVPYDMEIILKPENYSVDTESFEISFYSNKLFIPVPREKARKIVNRPLKIVGTLRYYDDENFILTEASIIDEYTKESYDFYIRH